MRNNLTTVAWTFVGLHVIAMLAAMGGLLIAIPHPDLWAQSPGATQFYAWAIGNMGTVDILTATGAMIFWGASAIGWRKTLLFAAIACTLSASAELTGTKTGWPFGGYSYTGFLGFKLGGRVPYTVPLSWFYMGFAGFVLASAWVQHVRLRNATAWSIIGGALLLTAWDLVLDPAMASPTLSYMHFWEWHEHGAYFGMPLRNLLGWFGTGLTFIAVSRLAWRGDLNGAATNLAVPYTVYLVNIIWAMALSLSVGLWQTAIAAVIFAALPATIAAFRIDLRGNTGSIVPEGAAR
jgi:putative membrane protein